MRVIPDKYLREIQVGSQQEISETITRKNLKNTSDRNLLREVSIETPRKISGETSKETGRKPKTYRMINSTRKTGRTVGEILLWIVGSDTEKTFGINPERGTPAKTREILLEKS